MGYQKPKEITNPPPPKKKKKKFDVYIEIIGESITNTQLKPANTQ